MIALSILIGVLVVASLWFLANKLDNYAVAGIQDNGYSDSQVAKEILIDVSDSFAHSGW